ncbi:MAG: M43 family zinc metalloprotease [Ferruginibacter sp.]
MIAITIAMLFTLQGFAQKAPASAGQKSNGIIRCGTMEYYDELLRQDPLLEAKAQAIAAQKLKAWNNRPAQGNRPADAQAVVVIPVVFHVVGTAANQAFVSDASIQRQVDVLNRDYAGANPDSVNIPAAFKPLFGHSNIRFALAKRTPTNTATNGVERRVSAQTFTSGTVNNLKQTALGGLDQWNGDNYLNIWVANFTDGLLGIATFPNTGAANLQGVAIHFGSIDQPCGSPFAGSFDGGRTLAHEVGHYLYLFHIWGDDNGACTGSDFRTPYGVLPASCTDDTPNQAGASSGCLSGVQTDACSNTAPGFMYQSYMDYTDDACYAMFSKGQACRAEACIDLYRASLKTSPALTPVTAINNDARVSEILNPASRGYACGTTSSFCSNTFTPTVLVVNDGDAPLTSLTFQIRIDGVNVASQPWTGSIAPSEFAYIPLSAVTSTPGSHILVIKTLNPNGSADGRPTTDSTIASFSMLPAAVTLPTTAQSFETTPFPPAGWRVINPDGGITWVRSTAAANPGVASARINLYNYNSIGAADYLVSPKLSTNGADTISIRFNVAYAKYSNTPADWDSLEVVYSKDCGITWIPTGYRKGGNALATNGGATVTGSFVPTAAQWRTETVKLGACGLGDEIVIGFKSYSSYGNNIYLDNILFDKISAPNPNLSLNLIQSPKGLYCDGNITPTVVVENKGNTAVTSFSVVYNIDGGANTVFNWTGNLARCSAPITINLAPFTAASGDHVFKVYTSNPNGTPDQLTANDTASALFSVISTLAAPVSQNFEGATFPPTNWTVQNFDNSVTWTKSTAAYVSTGAMAINNFSYPTANTVDRFVSPKVTTLNTADSAFISFDYSYFQGNNYPGSTTLPLDTLEVQVTTDCGATTQTIWKKWGENLQTVKDPNYQANASYSPTLKAQWKNERIYITPQIANSNDFQVFFVAKSNKQNNLFVDNINIFGKTLPARLKAQGYLIYPSPFNSSFVIHHVMAPVDLQAAQVYNSAGQLVWDKRYNGNATTEVNVDLKNMANGVYVLKMIYSGKTVVERIVKN